MVSQKGSKPGRPKETNALVNIGPDFAPNTPHDSLYLAEEEVNQQMSVDEQRLAQIDKEFGDGEPYNEDRIITETRTYLTTSYNAWLEAGKRLVLLKEHKKNDQEGFHQALDRIGLAPRIAQKMILVTRKFGGRPSLATLGKTKLLDLATLEDEVLDELEDGGTVDEVSKDDLDKMTSREVKTVARKLRIELADKQEVHERLLESKNKKIDELDRELEERRRRVKNWSGVVTEIGTNLTTMAGGAVMNMQHLREQIYHIQEECERLNLSKQEMEAIVNPFADHINTLSEYLRELAQDFSLNLSIYMPEFTASQLQPAED